MLHTTIGKLQLDSTTVPQIDEMFATQLPASTSPEIWPSDDVSCFHRSPPEMKHQRNGKFSATVGTKSGWRETLSRLSPTRGEEFTKLLFANRLNHKISSSLSEISFSLAMKVPTPCGELESREGASQTDKRLNVLGIIKICCQELFLYTETLLTLYVRNSNRGDRITRQSSYLGTLQKIQRLPISDQTIETTEDVDCKVRIMFTTFTHFPDVFFSSGGNVFAVRSCWWRKQRAIFRLGA